ncbi:hypothetical protein AWZ03_005055 [Drosophila navojoa]|uniref:Uncharacterized protein n=1 Tax=Drosophila navojoa TaxID=7232 RepID=A0A484BL96_DRONA|nr:hypothetical protein AWZ03_005055 [Drosophila navojoa]
MPKKVKAPAKWYGHLGRPLTIHIYRLTVEPCTHHRWLCVWLATAVAVAVAVAVAIALSTHSQLQAN